MISNLLSGHEQINKTLRKNADECEEKYHDMGTNDFLISFMHNHEKMLDVKSSSWQSVTSFFLL